MDNIKASYVRVQMTAVQSCYRICTDGDHLCKPRQETDYFNYYKKIPVTKRPGERKTENLL
jgi:hypothetical protein